MVSDKPKVLLVWGYHRKGWIEPFEQLKDQFEFVYVFFIRPQKDEISFTDCQRIYWSDFSTPDQLLDTVLPEKVIFMSVSGSNSIALNMACKRRNIITAVFQHGLLQSFQTYKELNDREIKQLQELKQTTWNDELADEDKLFLRNFFLSGIRWYNPFEVFFLVRFFIQKKRFGRQGQLFLKHTQSRYMRADRYYVFTIENAQVFVERDGVDPKQLIELGSPFMDEFFMPMEDDLSAGERYYLLIDEPLAYVGEYNSEGFTNRESVIRFQEKLNAFALQQQAKLYVKLHPYSYNADFYLKHDNIVYFKDASVPPLIRRAAGIFGTSSTLLIPAVYLNDCVLFKFWETSAFEEDCEQWGLVQKLDFHQFEVDEINFSVPKRTPENLEKLVAKYLYRTDGEALQRLSNQLKRP